MRSSCKRCRCGIRRATRFGLRTRRVALPDVSRATVPTGAGEASEAIEAAQRGYGGIVYIAGVLGYSTKTIERGMKELDQLQDDPAAGRVRRPGAGRKKRSNRSRAKKKT